MRTGSGVRVRLGNVLCGVEALHTPLNFAQNAADFVHVARVEMTRKFGQQGIKGRAIGLKQSCDIVLLLADAREVPTPVEQGERV
jgi:hypothetical protein